MSSDPDSKRRKLLTTTNTDDNVISGYIGIDNGTQGLSVIFTDHSLHVLATGEGSYDMVPDLPDGCYEQRTEDWDKALEEAMEQVREKLSPKKLDILGIGISGQMHGQVLCNEEGKSIGTVRLWCDARNQAEGDELTDLFQVKIPKRCTVARWLYTIRNDPAWAAQVRHMTTPAGWISYRLTGKWTLGIGDASGMFPIDQATLTYHKGHLKAFDELVDKEYQKQTEPKGAPYPSLESILPKVACAGQDAGMLSEAGARLLGLDSHTTSNGISIPVAGAEGDQPAAMAGSLIGRAGQVSCSFGTSVCANSVGSHAFQGVSPAVDHFCAHDGKPINMVWLRCGTTFMNTIVTCLGGGNIKQDSSSSISAFDTIMPLVVEAPPDCGGLIAMPFMDDEPGLSVHEGGTAMIMGWNSDNVKNPGNAAKAALLATMFNLKRGSAVLDDQGYPRKELILTGGLVKTPGCGQILADVFNTPVTLLESADEGSCWGAAVMAKYRSLYHREGNESADGGFRDDWATFLESVQPKGRRRFEPNPEAVTIYEETYQRYTKLLELQPQLNQVMSQK